jgi:signal transduction histidine kinase
VEQMVYNYKPLMLDKNIHFENKVLKAIWLMPTRVVKIILRNLLDNAIKFSNQDGAIKLYSQNVDSDFCDLVIEDIGNG